MSAFNPYEYCGHQALSDMPNDHVPSPSSVSDSSKTDDHTSTLPSSPSSLSSKKTLSYTDVFNPAINETSQICVPWTMNMDSWWTHHPEWFVSSETEDFLCFAREDSPKTRFWRQLYDLQFVHGNCTDVHTKHMWSSGLAADLSNIVDGLLHGLATNRPFQITFAKEDADWWHYAATKLGNKPVCPTKDQFCFFLPLSHCKPGEIDVDAYKKPFPPDEKKLWMHEYIMRQQQWLRRRVFEYMRDRAPRFDAAKNETSCAVIHVRRADVVLHLQLSRNYFAVADYLDRLKGAGRTHKTILLLTDDQNAIDEALEFHPDYNWKYLNRKRHRGKEGGWENQLPSKDPVEEMVALLATFRLVKQCDAIVHGQSGFSDMLFIEMKYGGKGVQRLRVEPDLRKVFNTKYSSSFNDLEKRLEERRKGTKTQSKHVAGSGVVKVAKASSKVKEGKTYRLRVKNDKHTLWRQPEQFARKKVT